MLDGRDDFQISTNGSDFWNNSLNHSKVNRNVSSYAKLMDEKWKKFVQTSNCSTEKMEMTDCQGSRSDHSQIIQMSHSVIQSCLHIVPTHHLTDRDQQNYCFHETIPSLQKAMIEQIRNIKIYMFIIFRHSCLNWGDWGDLVNTYSNLLLDYIK